MMMIVMMIVMMMMSDDDDRNDDDKLYISNDKQVLLSIKSNSLRFKIYSISHCLFDPIRSQWLHFQWSLYTLDRIRSDLLLIYKPCRTDASHFQNGCADEIKIITLQ